MSKIRSAIKTTFLSLATLFITLGAPVAGLSTAYAATCTAPSTDTPGVHAPTGSDANTYTYKCDGPYAGMYYNGYYTYSPTTGARTATYDPDYSYDCTTGTWTKVSYAYSPSDGQFHSHRAATTAPAGATTDCPVVSSSSGTGGSTGSGSTSGTGGATSSANGINGTGPNSSNNTNTDLNGNTTINNTTNASMNNKITGVATSGNSLVLGNTSAGGASSGGAQDIANVVNMLQSSSNALGSDSNLVVFTKNIDGDVNGDFLLDPSSFANVQNSGPGSLNNANTDVNGNLTVNNSTNASINNDINLDSTSGNAKVAGNTSGGDATSGSAQSVANVVNMINSALTAGKSFLGVVNINGNLNGDILLPDNFVDQMLASNVPTVNISTTGPSSSNNSNTNANSNTTVTNTNNLGINNNVNANASTGTAKVSGNTSGGSATSGNAKTNITAFNLTGSNVVGSNDLLVFVNVLGSWVGLIVNAPAGATAASLGGGITSTGPNSSNNSNTNVNSNAAINNTTNDQINNNITTNAKSGSASVSNNTKGGNATTGDAASAVNLLNVENSSLDLSGWFGILFINVFGTWNGSFGINTSAGDPIASSTSSSSSTANNPLLSFVPHASNGTTTGSDGSTSNAGGVDFNAAFNAATTDPADAASILTSTKNVNAKAAPSPQLSGSNASFFKRPAVIIASLVGLYIVGDALYSNRQRFHRSKA